MTEQTPDVPLPITADDLDDLVDEVSETFGLPCGDVVYDGVATAIMHLPAGKAYAPLSYFGNAARQNLAKLVAYNKLQELAKKRTEAAQAENPPKSDAPVGEPVQNS